MKKQSVKKQSMKLAGWAKQFRKAFALLSCLLLANASLMAQNVTIRGTISDASGEPLIGVTVQVPGTSVGTITDIDGNYQISVPAGSTRLQFSFIGFQNAIEQIGSRTVIDVRMREDAEMLDELVVVGFATQRRANITGAVSTVDVGRQLDGRPLPDLGRGLQGAVPGLAVTAPSGRLGAAPNIRIRGAVGTLIDENNNASNPLILLDGVEIPDITLVNPDDVESISVLKDAASTSIFGARAAFGVILITTRSGAEGKGRFSVNYSNNFSWATPTVLPTPARSYEGAQMALDMRRRQVPGAPFYQFTNNLFVDEASIERMREWERVFSGQNLGHEMVRGRDFEEIGGQVFFYRSFDPVAMFMRQFTPSQQHNVSVSGSQGNTNVHLAIGYMGQGGVIRDTPDRFDRYNVNMNFDTRVNDWLNIRGRFMFSRTDLQTPFEFNVQNRNFGPLYQLYRWPAFAPYGTYQGHPFRNAVTEMQAANSNNRTTDFMRLALGTTVRFTRELSLDMDYALSTNNTMLIERGGFVGGWDYWSGTLALTNNWANIANDNVLQRFDTDDHHAINVVLRYNKRHNRHNIGALTGLNIEEHTMRWMNGRRLGLLDHSKPEFRLADGEMFVDGSAADWAIFGAFARVNYSFDDKYLLELNARYDGSSRFPLDRLFGFFPSASAGWIFSQENFMESLQPVLSFGRLRASYGTIGNQAVGLNRFRSMMNMTPSNWIVSNINEPTFGMPTAITVGFSWETIETRNIGLDLRFFNNKLGLSADVFQRINRGMISAGEQVPATFGLAAPVENNGELTTNGWEIALDFTHTFSNGLRFGVTANVFDALSVITRHSNGPNTVLDGTNYQGRIWGEIWGFETVGFFTDADFLHDAYGNRLFFRIDEHGNREYGPNFRHAAMAPGVACQMLIEQANGWFVTSPGDIRYRDLVGNEVIDWGDNTSANPGSMRRIGNSTPRYQFATRFSLDYRGFDFELFLQGVGKRDLWRTGSMLVPGWNFAEAVYYSHQTDFWTPENPNARYPRLTPLSQPGVHARGAAMNFIPQTKYLLDMSYLRVRNITFGYSLPASLLNRVSVERLRIYLSLENLFEFHNLGDLPIDPETAVDGGDGGIMGLGRVYPFTRAFSFGLQLRL